MNLDKIFYESPLHKACINRRPLWYCKFLIWRGHPINEKNWSGCTPLFTAVEFYNNRYAELLIRKGADVNEGGYQSAGVRYEGVSPLSRAVINKDSVMISILMDSGANVNVKDIQGRTALYWAVCNEDIDLCKTFINAGVEVDLHVKDDRGGRLLDHAYGNAALIELLKKHAKE